MPASTFRLPESRHSVLGHTLTLRPAIPTPGMGQTRTKLIALDPRAVRDLFGTMHDGGASKGILVTTRGYGAAADEFADGKPLIGA